MYIYTNLHLEVYINFVNIHLSAPLLYGFTIVCMYVYVYVYIYIYIYIYNI